MGLSRRSDPDLPKTSAVTRGAIRAKNFALNPGQISDARRHAPRKSSRGIGGGGLFIESFTPLTVGTKLVMEFTLPETPNEWLSAKGMIAWVCPKADQYTFSPGMGVRFTDITPETRNRVLSLVHSVKGVPQGDAL